ncbi:MAG: 4Fe-4S binding protein [Nitrospirae bacterium]|nr:4Fe-4S binding protein [Nitrospirota bacterium]
MIAAKLIRIRHGIQWALLAAFVVLPFTGLFRVDVSSGRFLIGGMQIWWDDFFIVFPFWAMIFFSMTAFYSNFGMIFCGWMCPQHTLSEWLNGLARRLLGRRVLAGISPERAEGRSKRKRIGLVLAGLAFTLVVVLVAAVLTLASLRYFFTLDDLWGHFAQGRFNLYIAVFTIMLGTFVVIDLGLLRHFWCKYMCPYGLWQYMFRNRDTLQIRFAAERAADCRSCSLCKDVCPMDLDPRQPEVYTRCINCAICIDACEGYLGRFGKGPILSFGFGTRREELIRIQTRRGRVVTPSVLWPVGGVLVSALTLAYGVATFDPLKMVVHPERAVSMRATADHAAYSVHLVNKGSGPQVFRLSVDGLPAALVDMERGEVRLPVAEKAEVPLIVRHGGLAYDRPYPFRVLAVAADGGRFVADAVYYQPDLSAAGG